MSMQLNKIVSSFISVVLNKNDKRTEKDPRVAEAICVVLPHDLFIFWMIFILESSDICFEVGVEEGEKRIRIRHHIEKKKRDRSISSSSKWNHQQEEVPQAWGMIEE